MENKIVNIMGDNVFYISITDVDGKRHTVINLRQPEEIKRFQPLGDMDMLVTDIRLKYISNSRYYNKNFLGYVNENISINEDIHCETPLKLSLALEGILQQSGLDHLM